MDLEEQEGDGRVTRRRSARVRGGTPPKSISATSPTRGRGRGRGGRGRGGKSKGKVVLDEAEAEEEAGSSEADMSADEQDQQSQSSDTENSNSTNNTANGIDSSVDSSGAGLQESQGAELSENLGYSMSTTADFIDTSAIMDGEAFMQSKEQFDASMDVSSEAEKVAEEFMFPENDQSQENSQNFGNGSVVESVNESEDSSSKRKLEESSEDLPQGSEDLSASGDLNTSVGPSPPKKPLLEINVRKLLPDLEKHWKPVEDDPNDFTAWTYLLQYVDQENELLAAREAYDKFLTKYPYCYGYWKKYADYEKRKGSADDCEKVFQRGLKSISLSVDLWIHYLNYVKATHDSEPEIIRSKFEAAMTVCGMEFRSDKLWEHYIQWERENNNLQNVLAIYDRLIATPTQSYQNHFQNVKDMINHSNPADILSPEEFLEIKAGLTSSEAETEPLDEDAEIGKIKEKIIERRTEAYKKNETEITARWSFEEAIKRPYFHVKPLEKGQLKMWKEYLEFEIEKGDLKRIFILFERCLIACALYEEYWIKYARFLMSCKEKTPEIMEKIQDVFTRACVVHHPDKPFINLCWASFEESQENWDKAVEILERLDKATPGSLIVHNRRINFERRRGNLSKCTELYEKCIVEIKSKSPSNFVHMSILYAQFLDKIVGDYEKAKKILQEGLDVDETSRARCIMALIDLALERRPVDVELAGSTFDHALSSNLPEEQKVTFAHRKIEFLERFGKDIDSVEKAQEELQSLAKVLRDKKSTTGGKPDDAAPKNGVDEAVKIGAAPPTASNGAPPYDQYAYGQQYNQYGNYANWNYQQSSGYGYNQQGWNAYQGYYGGTDSTTGA